MFQGFWILSQTLCLDALYENAGYVAGLWAQLFLPILMLLVRFGVWRWLIDSSDILKPHVDSVVLWPFWL